MYPQCITFKGLIALKKTTTWFSTRMSWVSSCSVTARSFPCHNKVSGPRQHFFFFQKQRLSNSCSELCAVSAGTLPPTTSQGSFRPEQHKPGFPERSQYAPFYHLLQADLHSLQNLSAFSFVSSSLCANWVAKFVLKFQKLKIQATEIHLSSSFSGENATFTLWKLQGKVFP